MYYESRINQIKEISNLSIQEQIECIKSLGIGKAIKIDNIIWVNDETPHGTGGYEAAVLIEKDSNYYQFESITIPWCSDEDIEEFINDFKNESIINKKYYFNIDKATPKNLNNKESLNWFICACCGKGFKSTIKIQSQYDQDAGFGYCSDC
ncbi:hypothetical protein FHS04_002795 [Mesoflavibacter sabulilitoris]|uniref:Uncharacterized protein n=1 Tax=Mesoflavibacter zeaxanthinifaciens subsp. sabulilitoris TaxID=1520893 RepID=A0A2T1NNN0_9FLAO|nr:hypothetical protein [Mesoflavibacter zeaxanthinifaciens]MBB3125251.1 hypothetical protein [Mesoflavibacter zeaxanthinifaciens subsp. sabulilitoris]PSG94486.1 hypothetical protein C7H61_00705 [Mesoflavibacter zeaxanthinifaciens subsp. sabulilitoris]